MNELNNKTEMDAEELTLAPETELHDEAKRIAAESAGKEHASFIVEFDKNYDEELLSILSEIGCAVEGEEEKTGALILSLNEDQLAFLKKLDYVERLRENRPVIRQVEEEPMSLESMTVAAEPVTMSLDADDGGVAVASEAATASATSTCPESNTMATAIPLTIGTVKYGCICCPGAEQWYKFTVNESSTYTISTNKFTDNYNLDTVGYLYDSCGNLLAQNDDHNLRLYFKIQADLEEGQTYYVKVMGHGDNTGAYCVKVENKIWVTDVTVHPATVIMGVRDTAQLSATVYPANATEKRVMWISFNNNVATVDFNTGEVTAVGVGTTTIRVYDWDERSLGAQCTVYVGGPPVTGITLDFTTKTMNINDEDFLWESITPSNALNRTVHWSSSNPSVAEVYSGGKIKAKSVGTTEITARTEDGGFTAKCSIQVVSGIVVEKYPDANHSRIVFPNGKTWNCINFDIINDYNLDQDDPESQRFYDNVYETKVYDEPTEHTYYYEPFKEYSDEELKIIYMIDPHGMAAYVREYAADGYDPNNDGKTPLSETIAYKDRIFKMLFNRDPDYYARTIDGQWYVTSSRSNLTQLLSESESLFGTHPIYDMVTVRQFLTVLVDLLSMGIQCPALSRFKFFGETLPQLLKYFSLARSVRASVLSADFDGFLSAIINGAIDEDELDETIVLPDTEFKAANYNMGWAFEMLSLSSDLGALADTFNAGPHFYKEVFTQCASDTDYDVYLRTADGNLVSISNLANILD